MLIYEIPTVFGELPSPLNDFINAVIELENIHYDSVGNVCYFGINPPSEPYEKVDYIMNSKTTYLVFQKHYLPFFESLLAKYDAKKIDSSLSFKIVDVLAGSAQAIDKAFR